MSQQEVVEIDILGGREGGGRRRKGGRKGGRRREWLKKEADREKEWEGGQEEDPGDH